MAEKMTDERLEQVLAAVCNRAGMVAEAEALRAHIAALTAEVEQVPHIRKALDGVAPESARLGLTLSGRVLWLDADRKARVETLTAERDEARSAVAACAACAENVALRERVQALEAEKVAKAAVAMQWRRELGAANLRLAAIRQRAGEVRDSIAELDEHCRSTVLEVVNTVVGEDDAGAHPTVKAINEQLERAERLAERVESATPANPEPSTVEAFATVRKHIDAPILPKDAPRAHAAADALALLERRMGAQDAAIRPFVEAARETLARAEQEGAKPDARYALAVPLPLLRSLLAALTDAPPVFTLEEVQHAVWSRLGRNSDAEAIIDALRK